MKQNPVKYPYEITFLDRKTRFVLSGRFVDMAEAFEYVKLKYNLDREDILKIELDKNLK